jgi:hypothetical protein
MSTPPQTPPLPAAKPAAQEREIKIVSHSNLFYWWPVWAVGFLMALLTLIDNHYMVVVPKDAKAARGAHVKVEKTGTTYEDRDTVVFPKEHPLVVADPSDLERPAKLHMSSRGSPGVIFLITLLLVIVITNVPLRGMWSVVVIVTVILLSVILGLAHVGDPPRSLWEIIIEKASLLDIRINMAGYLFVSIILFAIWLITFIFFDQQTYIIFTPKQMKVRTEIGGGEEVFDTSGMTFKKQRSDLFRHWILGLGSGDLVVNTTGAGVHHFDLPNVLFIGKKVQDIEKMLAEVATVKAR